MAEELDPSRSGRLVGRLLRQCRLRGGDEDGQRITTMAHPTVVSARVL
jgi:hypothetical protein